MSDLIERDERAPHHTSPGEGIHLNPQQPSYDELAQRVNEYETRLHDLVEGSLQGIMITCGEQIVYANRTLGRMLGYTTEEVLGFSSWEQLIAPDSRATVLAYCKTRAAGGDAPNHYEYKGLRKDGSIIWLENLTRQIEWQGQPAVQATVIEITIRKEAELALRASEQRFRDFAALGADWFWEMDADLRYTYVSNGVSETGLTPYGVVGKSITEICRPGFDYRALDFELEAMAAQKPFRRHERIATTTPDHWVTVSGEPKFDEAGKFCGYHGVTTDITVRKRYEAQLAKSKEQAEAANQAKSEFLANMSHELRTPLNSIMGYSEIMSKELLGQNHNPKYTTYSSNIFGAAEHLLNLINDVLDISRIEAGEMRIEESTIDIRDLLEESLQFVRWRGQAKNQTLRLENPGMNIRLRADPRYLRQILINLLVNGIQYTPDGGDVGITATLSDDGEICITVLDTGIGIAETDIPKILEPFGKVQATSQQAHEGIGLGLPLSKKLVELHGGRLTIDSSLGQGTRVHIVFPAHLTVE